MKFGVILFLLLLCSSCVRTKPSSDLENDTFLSEPVVEDSYTYYPIKDHTIKVDLTKPQTVSLFDYFSHIELIPLETNDNVLIGSLQKLIYHQNRYYTLDRIQVAVQVFDETGKFMHKIGRSGQGPGEYLPLLYDIYINPYTGNIDLLCPMGYIYSYDLSGNHVKTSERITNDELGNINQVIAFNEKIYVFTVYASPYYIVYYDIEEKKILHQEYENFTRNVAAGFYYYNGHWYFKPVFDNSIYEIMQDSLKKAYTLDFGKFNYKITEEIFGKGNNNISNIQEIVNRYPYKIRTQGQNNQYVIANIDLKDEKSVNLIYDKSIHESKLIEHFTESVEFQPYIVSNDFVLSWCSHGALEKYVAEEMLDESNRQKFTQLIHTVGEELNPIIIKYYFK